MFRIRRFTALIITSFCLVVAVLFFMLKISGISVPQKFLKKGLENIRDSVKVYKNHYGIPHIIANNEHDAFFTVGYLHAEDRLWQMEYNRRIGMGALSEIFGSETINIDKFMHAIDIPKIAEKLWQAADSHTKKILEAYTDGINYFIDHNKTRLPLEFNALNFIPKHWRPVDTYIIGRLMSLSMSNSFVDDVTFGEISDRLGVKKALDLVPSYPQNVPYVLDDSIPKSMQKFRIEDTLNQSKTKKIAFKLLKSLDKTISQIKPVLGWDILSNGSNSWVCKKSTDPKSGAIIANDPHLKLASPAHWYQIHISFPGYNVVGYTIPGGPLVLVGRNNSIAWGITNMMADDCDFFIEKIDSSNNNYYILPSGKKEKFSFSKDTIKVKNSTDIYYYKQQTKRSAVISPYHTANYLDKNLLKPADESFLKKYCLTFSWTGQAVTNEFAALYQISRSNDWQQFVNATNGWGSPALCFTYADIFGNLGVSPTGLIPVRKLTNPNIPNPSWMDGFAWEGYKSGQDFPKSFNPSKRFVVSANNKVSRNLPFYVSDYWQPPSRSVRIEELLQIHNEYSARDAQFMQMDLLSPLAREILTYCLPTLLSMKRNMTAWEKEALSYLVNWDYIMSPASVGSSVFNVFFQKLLYNTFFDELGDKYFKEYMTDLALPTRKITELLRDSANAEWFDDIRTPQKEYKNYILLKSLRDAVNYMEDAFDEKDMSKWTWGKLHRITLKHVFGTNKFFEPTVNTGPYPIGGNGTTINNTDADIAESFDVTKYASMRFVADMDEQVIYSVIPGGASGDPQSPNYRDQFQLWLNGGYVPIPVSPTPDRRFSLNIIFYPK